MIKDINVGIIGFGTSGRVFHAPIIKSVEGFVIKKIFVRSEESMIKIRQAYPNIKIVDHVNKVLEDQDIDLVVIVVPNGFHYEIASMALNSGKHVIIEKPFTVSTEEADKLISLSEEQNKVLTVYHNRRWDSDFKTVKKVIESGMLGEIVEYEAHFDRFRDYIKENAWKERAEDGSGILYDLGSHLIDQAQCLFGLPEMVFADLRKQRKGSLAIDNFEIILAYPALKVTLKAGMLVRDLGPRYCIQGRNGSFVKYGSDPQEALLSNGIRPVDVPEWGKEDKESWGRIKLNSKGININGTVESLNGDYREFYRNIFNALNGTENLNVTALEARNNIRIIELAIKSNEEGRWVKFE